MKRIVVLVSGGGTNLQALIDAQKEGRLPSGQIVKVISSKEGVYALERAHRAHIPTEVISRRAYPDGASFDQAILAALERVQADLVVLAGFLCILGEAVVSNYHHRMINVHPSLIPSFCGDGFYGLRVHEAVLNYGVKITGATVHFVNEVTDGGEILLQKAVEIKEGDTPEILQRRVMEQAEWLLLPQAAEMVCKKMEQEESRCDYESTKPL